tara:strand:- start:3213 stop:4352 length:1140 start_codon:yes stop_codon:yes gene_type:complete
MATGSRYMYPMVPPRGPLNNDEDISAGRQWPARNIDYLKLTIYDPEKSSPYTYINNNSDAQFGTFGGGTASEDAIHASIYLHMPHQLNENYQVRYNKATLGPFGDALATAVNSVGQDSTKTIGDITKSVQGGANAAAPQAIFNAISGAFNSASGLGIDASVSRDQLTGLTKQRVFNPYEETVFEGTNYRSHSFEFDMVPRNPQEVTQIRNIISMLRDSMLPGMDGTVNQWLTIPRFFKASMVRYQPPVAGGDIMNGEERLNEPAMLSYIMQFPVKMVLTGMEVNLTPMGSHTSLRDMAWGGFPMATGDGLDQGPAAYKMTLNFDETAFITRNLLAGGTGYKQDWDGVGDQSDEASLMDKFIDDQNRINAANDTTQGGNT